MGHEVGALVEALPALATPVGPLSRVDPLVLNEGGAVGEPFAAVVTLKGPLARVCPLVRGQV